MKNSVSGFFIVIVMLFWSCKPEVLPKPKSYLQLHYKESNYNEFNFNCPYSFEVSSEAVIKPNNNCWMQISYPKLKATIHITYRPVANNLDEILKEVEKLTFEHTVKADVINATPFEDYSKRVFGKLYNVEGNVATNVQFQVTDSLKHVLAGALYFHTRPNYDSILPAIKFIEKDIKHIVETIEWKK